MTRALLAVLAATIALAGWQTWRLSGWRDRAETAEAKVSAYAEAARIRAEQDRRLAQLRDDAARLDHDLAGMEGADAPLSDYLRDAAGRVWSR